MTQYEVLTSLERKLGFSSHKEFAGKLEYSEINFKNYFKKIGKRPFQASSSLAKIIRMTFPQVEWLISQEGVIINFKIKISQNTNQSNTPKTQN